MSEADSLSRVEISSGDRQLRNPWLVWALVPISCHLFGYYWWFVAAGELRDELDDPAIQPERMLLFSLLTCGLYALFILPFRFGAWIQAAQRKAGMAEAKNHGLGFFVTVFVFYAGYGWMQHELNKVWRGRGLASAADG